MKKWKKVVVYILSVTMLIPLLLGFTVQAADGAKKLDVLFTHDTHSHLNSFSTVINGEKEEVGGFAKIKTLIDEQKKNNPGYAFVGWWGFFDGNADSGSI